MSISIERTRHQILNPKLRHQQLMFYVRHEISCGQNYYYHPPSPFNVKDSNALLLLILTEMLAFDDKDDELYNPNAIVNAYIESSMVSSTFLSPPSQAVQTATTTGVIIYIYIYEFHPPHSLQDETRRMREQDLQELANGMSLSPATTHCINHGEERINNPAVTQHRPKNVTHTEDTITFCSLSTIANNLDTLSDPA